MLTGLGLRSHLQTMQCNGDQVMQVHSEMPTVSHVVLAHASTDNAFIVVVEFVA